MFQDLSPEEQEALLDRLSSKGYQRQKLSPDQVERVEKAILGEFTPEETEQVYAEIDTAKKSGQLKRISLRLFLREAWRGGREGWREASKETPMDTSDWVWFGVGVLGLLLLVSMLVFKLT